MAARRAEFTDDQKAQIFVRDRAICCFSGKSLWHLDFGGGPCSPDWTDHIRAAARGGMAELSNGACASWIYNKLKRDSGDGMYLFLEGRPTVDFFTFYEIIPPHISSHLRRFAKLHHSDWYFNRAVFKVQAAAAVRGQRRRDGKAFSRNTDYWAASTLKFLVKWRAIVDRETPGDLFSRGLLPSVPSPDQNLLADLQSVSQLKGVKQIISSLVPFRAASWKALEALSEVRDKCEAIQLLAKVDANRHVVPRVKQAVRHNITQLFL